METTGKGAEDQLFRRCEQLFVHGDFQMVHSITFSLANGHGATVIGVTVREGDTLTCALMGVEGFLLFEAVFDGELQVKRALPPFDKLSFARGLMLDVQTLFLLPQGAGSVAGKIIDESRVCRYLAEDERITDVIATIDGTAHINIYNGAQNKIQDIVFTSFIENEMGSIPEIMELTTMGSNGYTLTMTLISAEKI